MIDVERVDSVRVPVTDIEQANRFYGELLGLRRSPNRRYAPYPDGSSPDEQT